MIGPRLKAARVAAGLSLRDLEAKIGNRVTAQAIGKYERNADMPSAGVLSALAEALGLSKEYLLSPNELTFEGVEFRKKAIASKREETSVEGRTLQLLERYLAVEGILGLASVVWDRPREAPYPVRAVADAENAARALRTHWGLGIESIPSMVELLEERGIKVLSVELDNIDGLMATVTRKHGEPVPVIVVKTSAWAERKRFTLSHELGHMVTQVATGVNAESAAHRFAGAFLMPAEALWAEIGKSRTSISLGELLHLKLLFGASFQCIAFRCRDLQIIGDTTFRTLFKIFSQRGWRSPPYREPGAIDPKQEEPTRLERLCFRALAEGMMTDTRAAELIGVSLEELTRLMDHPTSI